MYNWPGENTNSTWFKYLSETRIHTSRCSTQAWSGSSHAWETTAKLWRGYYKLYRFLAVYMGSYTRLCSYNYFIILQDVPHVEITFCFTFLHAILHYQQVTIYDLSFHIGASLYNMGTHIRSQLTSSSSKCRKNVRWRRLFSKQWMRKTKK